MCLSTFHLQVPPKHNDLCPFLFSSHAQFADHTRCSRFTGTARNQHFYSRPARRLISTQTRGCRSFCPDAVSHHIPLPHRSPIQSQRAAYAATRTLDSCAGTQTSKREVRRKILLRKISNCGGERFRICDCCNSRVSTQKPRSAHEGQIVLEGLIKQWCIQFLRAFQSIASYSKHTRPITSPKTTKAYGIQNAPETTL
jgi:hypothetical protein